MIFIVADETFLNSILVDADTIKKMNLTSKLTGKRNFYLQYYKTAFFEHLKTEYNLLHASFPEVEIVPEARIKGKKSYKDKMAKVIDGYSEDIYDIFGNRYVIVSVNGSREDEDIIPILYEIRDFLAYSFEDKIVLPERMKDYVQSPKHSTYQSLHITRLHSVPGFRGFHSETQLRSYFMHANARGGLASHANSYKERIAGITPLPHSIEYVLDENGFCTEIREKSIEQVFEEFFGIPYNPDVFSDYESEK